MGRADRNEEFRARHSIVSGLHAVVTRLPHAEDGEEADRGGGGDVVADPGDTAPRLENLRPRWGERGAENAAEIVRARRAGIAHLGRKIPLICKRLFFRIERFQWVATDEIKP